MTAISATVDWAWNVYELEWDIESMKIWNIKHIVTTNFTTEELARYHSLKWLAKNKFLMDKTLSLMNWTNTQIDKIVLNNNH